MELKLAAGDKTVAVSDQVFGRTYNAALVHQVVTAYLAAGRAGTKAQKNRSAVRGGGKKPWRQKGTGRARAGTIRSPLWTGGGVTFAAAPRKFAPKVNRKMYRAAMQAMLSELLRQERFVLISEIVLERRNTKALLQALADSGGTASGLLVVAAMDDNLRYSARNIVGLDVVDVAGLDPVSLAGAEQIMITEQALQALEDRLA